MSTDFLLSRFNSFSLVKKGLTPLNLSDRIKKKFIYTPNSKTLYIITPAWGAEIYETVKIQGYVLRRNSSFLAYSFPREIFSDNHELTKECFKRLRDTVKDEIEKLKERYNFTKCILIGSSLGAVHACMIASDNPDIDELVLITPANSLAEAMWTGCRTQHLRHSYEKQNINLEQLKNYWYDLAPENNINLGNKKISVYLSKADRVIPCDLGEKLVKEMEVKNLKPKLIENKHLGHYLTLLCFYLSPEKFLDL